MISLLVPSRARPKRLGIAHSSFFDLQNNNIASWEMICRIDDDDPFIDAYKILELAIPNLHVAVGDRHEGYARNDKFIEECAKIATGDLLMQIVDTARVETDGWNEKLQDAMVKAPNGYFVMFPSVTPPGSYRFSFPSISRAVYEACGCFCLGGNPSVDRCWEAFVNHCHIEIPCPITIYHKELRGTKEQDETAAQSNGFYQKLNKEWVSRVREFNKIGKEYGEKVLEKMNAESRLQSAEDSSLQHPAE